MSRSGYTDDYGDDDPLAMGRYRQAVAMAFKGKRGQAFLREMLAALDALPEKRLVQGELETPEGAVCAIGSVGRKRGMGLSKFDPDDIERVAGAFGIADSMAREIVWMNDEVGSYKETPEERFVRVRKWIESEIKAPPKAVSDSESSS